MEYFPKILLLLVVCIPLALVIANRLRMDLAAMVMAASLGILQLFGMAFLGPVNTSKDAILAISGFSQPVVITLLSLFIITRGLDKSGMTRWIAHRLIKIGGKNVSHLIALFAGTTALLSLFMNNLAAGALLLPSAMEVARRTGIKPSKLLIPVAYGSLLGGTATYFTTANIIMSDLLRIANPPQTPLNILDFTPTGGLIAMAGILFLWVFGKRLLPDREPSDEQALARLTGSELEDFYQIGERLWEACVLPGSSLQNKTLKDSGIGHQWGISIAAIRREHEDFILPSSSQSLHTGDILLLVGREEKIIKMKGVGLEIQPASHNEHLSARGITFFEVVLSPHSRVVGQTLKELDFRKRFGLTVVALKRLNRSYRTDVGNLPLEFGDSLLVIGAQEQIKSLKRTVDFIVIEPNPADQPIHRKAAIQSTLIILCAIAASVAGAPVYLCMLVGALCTVLLKILPMEEAYQSIEWQAVFLIAGMYAVSLAIVQTGTADMIGTALTGLVKPLGPLGIAAGAYLLTALLTQVMGGQVTALVTGPIMISAAISIGASPQAVAVATAIGCSASFLTPMAHPVNILMIGPANYKFTDFLRVGWSLSILCFLVLMLGMVVFWGM
jgi:di/tricarboxylate transporter